MFHRNQRGALDVYLVLALALILGVGGFVLWRILQARDNVPLTSTITSKDEAVEEAVELKEYSNKDVALSFSYPGDWTLEESLANGDMGLEGKVTLTSPGGLKVVINPNFGGRGGDCQSDPADVAHNTDMCSTIEVLSKEKTEAKSNLGDVYLFRVRFTEGKQTNPNQASEYAVFLSNNEELVNATEPIIGAWYGTGLIGQLNNKYNYDNYTEPTGTSLDFFNEAETKQAEAIFKSVKIL